jgi:hypothetical protein
LRGASGPCLPPYFRPWSCSSKKKEKILFTRMHFFYEMGPWEHFHLHIGPWDRCHQGRRQGRLAGAPGPRNFFFFSPSLNNIYIFSLNNKTINILALLIWFSGSAPGCHHAFFLQERPWDVLFQPSCIFSTRWVCGETLV